MPEIFLSIVLETSIFMARGRHHLQHLDNLIHNGIVQLSGVQIHIPYAVKHRLHELAADDKLGEIQRRAFAARRWIADNQEGLQKETWYDNQPAANLFPNQPKDQVLHYASQLITEDRLKYAECWLITQDPLLQLSARANSLRGYNLATFQVELRTLFPVNYLNTRWMIAAMEHRMELEMAEERRKRARFILVVEVGVLLQTRKFHSFLSVLAKDRRKDFMAGIEIDVPRVVMDGLTTTHRDIACRHRDPEGLIGKVLKTLGQYRPNNCDSHIAFHVEPMRHWVEGKPQRRSSSTSSGRDHQLDDYNEGLVQYCRSLVESLGETHVVALLTDDGSKRKLMRNEAFHVITVWPA